MLDDLIFQSLKKTHGGVVYNTEKFVQKILEKQKKQSPIDFSSKIKGVYFNADDNICSYVTADNEEEQIDEGIDMNDLAVALYIFCNPDIKKKSISFSLDSLDEKNPEGDYLKKVVYPDDYEENKGMTLIAGTEFSEIMFEADWLMKQLSMKVEVVLMDPLKLGEFDYD